MPLFGRERLLHGNCSKVQPSVFSRLHATFHLTGCLITDAYSQAKTFKKIMIVVLLIFYHNTYVNYMNDLPRNIRSQYVRQKTLRREKQP